MRNILRIINLGVVLAFGMAAIPAVRAQFTPAAPGAPAAPAAPRVGTIEIRFVGAANVGEQLVRANMQVQEGAALDDVMINRDIRTLYLTNLFEDVKHTVLPRDGNVVDLIFELTPKYKVRSIRFEGNQRKSSRELERNIKSRAGFAHDPRQLKEDSETLIELYEKAGYSEVLVDYEVIRDRPTGSADVVFTIREGPRTRITDIQFTGNAYVSARTLRRQMDTKEWGLLSRIRGTGRYKDFIFQDDLAKLRDYYRAIGFLDVEIAFDEVRFEYPRPEKLVLVIPIKEGRQYRVGEISITGNTIHPSNILTRLIRVRTGSVFVPSLIDEDATTIQDFYGRDGYLSPDTSVDLIRKPNTQTGAIDLEFAIREGPKFQMETISLQGNDLTKSVVILRELTFAPGDVFSEVEMKLSKLRLENTGFFDAVEMTPVDTNLEGRRNLKVSIKEGRTGNLQLGAGFSSVEQGSIFLDFSQGNFDLFNARSFFRGDGQKFRMRLSLGDQASEALIQFEEPWLFEQRLGLGFNIYRTSASFTSTYYSEVRTGFNVFLRKTLVRRLDLDGRVDYTSEVVSIEDVAPDASNAVRSIAGETTISKVGFQLLRDTRNRTIGTTSGTRFQFDAKVAGGFLGGTENYYSLEYRGAQYFPTFRAQEQTIALLARGGVINNFGDSLDVPYYDLFFLGGPDSLRPFDYREVGPRDPFGEPAGGKTYGMFSAEYSLDVVRPIRFAVFYDAGFVNRGAFDFNPAAFNDGWGVSLRLFIAGSPVSFDLGFPLTRDRTGRQGSSMFNFSFGGRF